MGQFIDYDGAEKLGCQLIDEAYNVAELAGITPLNSRDEEWRPFGISARKQALCIIRQCTKI